MERNTLKLSKCGVGGKWKKLAGNIVTNEEVLTEVGKIKSIMDVIKRRQ